MAKTKQETTQETISGAVPQLVNQDLVAYVKSGYPLVCMVTAEENRAELEISRVAAECNRKIYVWSCTTGLLDVNNRTREKCEEPVKALMTIREAVEEQSICVMRDMHPFFKNPAVVRHLRDIAKEFKQKKKTCILLSPVNQLPPELERDAVVLDFDLPTKAQVTEIWKGLSERNAHLFTGMKQYGLDIVIDEDESERIIEAAMGLTSVEAENAFSKATVMSLRTRKDRALAIRVAQESKDAAAIALAEAMPDPTISKLVMREKAIIVRKNGILEYFEAKEKKDDIGGLDTLKKWVDIRSKAFSKKARDFGLPMPKGILLVGLPGCGKSLTAKAAANILGVPLIRFDISRVFGGIVGQSETQMRSALQTIDRVGNCVVWIDEADKAFAGVGGSGANDSGVTKRVFGSFLTWMQEKSGASFVVMTVNNIDAIASSAPEMLRKGRFDEIFFVGLPSVAEREAIIRIHIRKNNRDPENFDIRKLALEAEGFSGAELEMTVIEGLYSAFYEDTELNEKHVMKSIRGTNPLSKSQREALESMKRWAENNAVNASIGKDKKSGEHAGRDIEV